MTDNMQRRLSLTLIFLIIISSENVSASFRTVCSEFLATQPKAMDADFNEFDSVKVKVWDGDYLLHHEMTMWKMVEVADNDTLSFCISFHIIKSRTVHKFDLEEDDASAFVSMGLSYGVPTGYVNVSAECWAREKKLHTCGPVFMPMPSAMNTPVFAHSPLNREFWNLQDENMVSDMWFISLYVRSIKKTIPSSWVSGLQLYSLTALTLKGNDWGRPEKLLSNVPRLNRLDLSENNIQELPKDIFNNTQYMKGVILSSNNISVFPSGLENLEYLDDVEINNVEGETRLVMTDEDIASLHRVSEFRMENMTLSANITALLELPKLRTLGLRRCGIDKIDDIDFELERTFMQTLDLSNNNLFKIPHRLFSAFTHIFTLLLQRNNLVSCSDIIDYFPGLQRLELQYNKISRITSQCFNKTHHRLSYIDLSHNRINYIMDGAFKNLTGLKELKLSYNKLSSILPSVFEGLSHISLLDLSNNRLTSEIQFKSIQIEKLNLSNNSIVNIENLSNTNAKILELDISRNNITRWDKFPYGIKILNMSYNAIETISKEMLKMLDTDIELIELGGNPLNCCDQDLKDVKMWLKHTKTVINELGTQHLLKCHIPGENQRYPIIGFTDAEGLCHEQGSSSIRNGGNDESVLNGVIAFLAVLVIVLFVVFGFIVYNLRVYVKFTDS